MTETPETDERAALYAMQAPTQLTQQDMIDILEQYRLDSTEHYISHKHLTGGLSNSNYRLITSARSLLVKVCDNKSMAELETQIRALIGFKQSPSAPSIAYPVRKTQDTPTSAALEQSDSYIYQSPASSKPIVLYDFLDGKPPTKATNEVMTQLAHALAALHNIAVDSYRYLPEFPMGIAEMQPFLDTEVPALSLELQQHSFITLLRENISKLMPVLESEALKTKQSIVHGDLFLENVVFTCEDDPKLLGLIDFEEMCVGHSILDVAMTIVGCCYDTRDELNWELTETFLREYQHVKPLSKDEIAAFPQFLLYACLSIGFWRFRQFVVRTPDVARKDSYMSMVKRMERIDSARLINILSK